LHDDVHNVRMQKKNYLVINDSTETVVVMVALSENNVCDDYDEYGIE